VTFRDGVGSTRVSGRLFVVGGGGGGGGGDPLTTHTQQVLRGQLASLLAG
jgi:hypothetical protein